MKKRLVLVCCLQLTSYLVICQVTNYKPSALTNYMLLDEPRTNIKVGGKWDSNLQSNISSGLPDSDLDFSASISNLNSGEIKQIKSKVETAFLNKIVGLNLKLDIGSAKGIKVDLQELEIVQIKNLEKMSFDPDGLYVFAAARVKKILVSNVKKKVRESLLKIKTLPDSILRANVEYMYDDTTAVAITGSNLYVGVMALTLSRKPLDYIDKELIRDYTESVVFSPRYLNRYEIRLSPLTHSDELEFSQDRSLWSEPRKEEEKNFCYGKLTVTDLDKNRIIKKFKIKCEYGDKTQYRIDYFINENGVQALSIEFPILRIKTNDMLFSKQLSFIPGTKIIFRRRVTELKKKSL